MNNQLKMLLKAHRARLVKLLDALIDLQLKGSTLSEESRLKAQLRARHLDNSESWARVILEELEKTVVPHAYDKISTSIKNASAYICEPCPEEEFLHIPKFSSDQGGLDSEMEDSIPAKTVMQAFKDMDLDPGECKVVKVRRYASVNYLIFHDRMKRSTEVPPSPFTEELYRKYWCVCGRPIPDGLPCPHFFSVFKFNAWACFHIGLLHPSWLKISVGHRSTNGLPPPVNGVPHSMKLFRGNTYGLGAYVGNGELDATAYNHPQPRYPHPLSGNEDPSLQARVNSVNLSFVHGDLAGQARKLIEDIVYDPRADAAKVAKMKAFIDDMRRTRAAAEVEEMQQNGDFSSVQNPPKRARTSRKGNTSGIVALQATPMDITLAYAAAGRMLASDPNHQSRTMPSVKLLFGF